MKELIEAVSEQAPSAGTSGYAARLPAPALVAVSAVFHYFGPAFAVLLFARLDVFGVAWLRVASAAVAIAAVAIHQQPTRHADREETRCGTPA
jgi:inner membrane transporter RhtA